MALLRATVVLNKLSGKPEDACRNVWHFNTGAAINNADMITASEALAAFYQALDSRLAGSISRAVDAHKIEFADVAKGGAGAADDSVSQLLMTSSFQTVGGAIVASDFPAETAIALSFRGDIAGVPEEAGLTRPKSRRRGRVFLGPFNISMGEREAVTNRWKVNAAHQTTIMNAYNNQLIARIGQARVIHHVVYSPTSALAFLVTNAHVDDAFDTIRSRGEKAVGRVANDIGQPVLAP
jgi:hypothetical protein